MSISDKWRNTYPRLFYDRVWVNDFQRQLSSGNSTAKDINEQWQTFRAEADDLLGAELYSEDFADGVDSQHGNYNKPGDQISAMGITLGMAYHVTQNEAYAKKLRDALLHYSTFKKWYGSGMRYRKPPWQSELNTARFCYGFATGYDALYDYLSEDERRTIRTAVIELGILPTLEDWIFPETRIHAMDSMGHNWWSVCVSQAGLAVLAILDDEPRAERWLARIVREFPHYFSYKGSVLGMKSPNYDDRGGFYESVNYAVYGLAEYLLFRLAHNRLHDRFDTADIPLLNKVGDFFIHTFYPSTQQHKTVNFGDGHIHKNAALAAKLLLAARIEQPTLRWYLRKYASPFQSLDFIYYDRIHAGEATPPPAADKAVLYGDIGWAMIRDSWQEDATLLAVKSGFTWNHAHADAGSFALFHQGKSLVMDSGNCSYGRNEYGQYYVQSQAHNVLLFEGEGQHPRDVRRGVKEPGNVYNLVQQGDFRYVYADATGPMARHFDKHFRHFMWVDDVLLIMDDVLAHRPGRMQWLVHPDGDVTKRENGDFHIGKDGAGITVRSIFPQNRLVTEEEGLADHDPDQSIPYYAWHTSGESDSEKLMTAIILGEAEPEIIPLEDELMSGVRIRSNGKETDVYWNHRADGRVMHRNGIQTFNGWETDAYFLVLTRSSGALNDPSSLERWFIANGSYVRKEHDVLFHSISKATCVASYETDNVEVSITGQPRIDAEIYVPDRIGQLKVNGQTQRVDFQSDTGLVHFQTESTLGQRRPG